MDSASSSLSPSSSPPPPPDSPSLPSLPAELLLHILSFALTTHAADVPAFSSSLTHHSFRRRFNPVVAFSAVSKGWRALVEGSGTSWATLHLDGEIDGERAEEKAAFWVERATRKSRNRAGERIRDDGEDTGRSGVTSLYLSNVQCWTDDQFDYLTETLELVHRLRLTSVHISWAGVASSHSSVLTPLPTVSPPPDSHRQLQSFFRFLLFSSSTLTSLTLHTPTHLRILFSLPRLAHTFSSLESIEILSIPSSVPASDSYLVPAFLPRYAGETDWEPLHSLKRLTLVGPIWRLRYRDGTVASPTLEAKDVPALEYARLSSTSPQVHWDLLSSPSIKHLLLEDWFDQKHLPDPDFSTSGFTNLTTLSLSHSPHLTTRLFGLALALPGLHWPNLETLSLVGATLSQPHLDLFASPHAPKLSTLDLTSTSTIASPSLSALTLPPLPALRQLTLLRTSWITPKQLIAAVVFQGRFPRLAEVRMEEGMGMGEEGRRALGSVGVRLEVEEEEGEEQNEFE